MGKPTGNPVGRPTKLTPELEKELLGAIMDGATFRIACDLVGIHVNTLKGWVASGNQDWEQEIDSEAALFSAAFARARAMSAVRDTKVLIEADKPVWEDGDTGKPMYLPESALSAKKFMLAARFPGEFGKSTVEVSGPGGTPIQSVSNEEAVRQVRAIYGLDTPPLAPKYDAAHDTDPEE